MATKSNRVDARQTTLGPADKLLLAAVAVDACLLPLTFNPFSNNWFGPIKLALLAISMFLVCLASALAPDRLSAVAKQIRRSSVFFPLALFITLTVASIATHGTRLLSVIGTYPEYQGVFLWLAAGAAALGFMQLAEDRRFEWLSKATSVALSGVSLAAIAQAAGIGPLADLTAAASNRIGSTTGNASNLGVYLILAIPLALWLARTTVNGIWRSVGWTSLTLGAVALVISMSRGAWLGAAAGAAVWALVELPALDQRSRQRVGGTVLGVLLAGAVVVVLAVPGVTSRATSAFDPQQGSVKWRTQVWGAALGMIAERPVLGYGVNQFRYTYPLHRPRDLRTAKELQRAVGDPHNIEISAAVALGVPGALALIALIGSTLWAGIGRALRERTGDLAPVAAATASVGALVALQFHFVTLDTLPLMAIVMASQVPPVSNAGGVATKPRGVMRWVLWGAAGLVGLTTMMAIAAPIADTQAAIGAHMATAEWAPIRGALNSARRLAPWEPAYDQVLCEQAGAVLSDGFDRQVWIDGIAAARAGREAIPVDANMARDEGRLQLMGGSYFGQRRPFEQAREAFTDGTRLDPYDASEWEGLALAQGALGDWVMARGSYKRALSLDPTSELARRGLTEALQVGQPNPTGE